MIYTISQEKTQELLRSGRYNVQSEMDFEETGQGGKR